MTWREREKEREKKKKPTKKIWKFPLVPVISLVCKLGVSLTVCSDGLSAPGLEWKHADLRNWGSKRNIILIFPPCLSTAVRHMKEVAVVSSTRREGRHSSQFLLAGGVSGRPSSQSWIIISLTARNELQEWINASLPGGSLPGWSCENEWFIVESRGGLSDNTTNVVLQERNLRKMKRNNCGNQSRHAKSRF